MYSDQVGLKGYKMAQMEIIWNKMAPSVQMKYDMHEPSVVARRDTHPSATHMGNS